MATCIAMITYILPLTLFLYPVPQPTPFRSSIDMSQVLIMADLFLQQDLSVELLQDILYFHLPVSNGGDKPTSNS
jgi:hypothetical protein